MNNDQLSRLITEAQETAERMQNLNWFMGSITFPKLAREDKDLMYSQQRVMSKYLQILGERIERAGGQFVHTEASPAQDDENNVCFSGQTS